MQIAKAFPGPSGGGAKGPSLGAQVDLDFVRRRYYWGGAFRTPAEFASFTGGTFTNGIVLDGVAANHDIRVLWSALGVSFPCVMMTSFTPNSVTGSQNISALDIDATNFMSAALNAALHLTFIQNAGVPQASINTGTAVIGTKSTIGANIETNNILQSINGITNGTADATATLITPTSLRIGKRAVNAEPFNGTIHRVMLFSGTRNQTQLNTLTARVHAI